MDIRTIIELKYNDLVSFCNKNVVQSIENKYGIKDFEDIDILHSIICKYLKKYKNVYYTDIDDGYQKIKKEFLGEKSKYTKKKKEFTKYFVELSFDINGDLNEI